MKKYYKTDVSIFYKQSDLYDNIIEEKEEIIVEKISNNRKYKEFVTGYPIKAVYLYPVTFKEIMHDAFINIGNPEKYINDEINEKGAAILFSLSILSQDSMNNHLKEIKDRNELLIYLNKFSKSNFYEVYKNIMDNKNKVKVKVKK